MKRILCVDGGGMRGLLPCAILSELERRTGKQCFELFDLVAGTSIGGITASLLAKGVTAADAMKFFPDSGPQIFSSRFWSLGGLWAPKYSGATIESVLQSKLGVLKLYEAKTRLLVTALDSKSGDGHFFKSYGKESDDMMWWAARATSAAQTYFPSFNIRGMELIDGGNVANNPSACALADAVAMWGVGEHIRILSLGCGMDAGDVNRQGSIGNAGAIRVGLATIKLLFEADSSETDYILQLVMGEEYCRFQPKLSQPLALDDASPAGLAKLMVAASKAVADAGPTLDRFLAP